VTLGPGSFTGIRWDRGRAGLGHRSRRPCLGLSALEVLASLVPHGPVVALRDAWRNEVYAGVYAPGQTSPPFTGPLEGLSALLPPGAVFVGDGTHRYRERLRELWPNALIADPDLFLAAPLGRLATPLLAAGRGHGPESLAPLYVRGADIRLPSP
jgi:tRNA A37 threonylcarbamoyladenosine modification protein TsaB